MQKQILKGAWWIPSNADEILFGDLIYSPETGIELNLTGPTKLGRKINQIDPQNRLLLGETLSGERVTLLDWQISQSNFTSDVVCTIDCVADVAFIGAHFTHPDQLMFERMDLGLSYLDDWAREILPMYFEFSSTDDFFDTLHVLKCATPLAKKSSLDSSTISVIYEPSLERGLNEAILKIETLFRVQVKTSLSFQAWSTDWAYPLQNLITLGTGKEASVTNIHLYSSTIRQRYFDKEQPISVLHRLKSQTRDVSFVSDMEMLFTMTDPHFDFAKSIQKWMQFTHECEDLYSLYFAVRYKPELYAQHQFLSFAQLIESYHRERRFLGNMNFKTRIDALVTETNQLTESFAPPDTTFAQKLLDTRNYLTHYDQTKRERALREEELIHLMYGTMFLIEACLLQELGFTG